MAARVVRPLNSTSSTIIDRFAGDVERNDCGMHVGRHALIQIVAVHRCIQDAERDLMLPDAGENFGQSRRQVIAAHRNADQHNFGIMLVALGDLVGDASE